MMIQSNRVKIQLKDDASEAEWEFKAMYAIEVDVSKEKKQVFQATYAFQEYVAEGCGDQHEDHMAIKIEDRDRVTVKEEIDEFVFSQEEIEMVTTQPRVHEWLVGAGVINKEAFACQKVLKQGEPGEVIQTVVVQNNNMRSEEEISQAINKLKMVEMREMIGKGKTKIEDHWKMGLSYSTQFEAQGMLIEGIHFDQATREKFAIGAYIK